MVSFKSIIYWRVIDSIDVYYFYPVLFPSLIEMKNKIESNRGEQRNQHAFTFLLIYKFHCGRPTLFSI